MTCNIVTVRNEAGELLIYNVVCRLMNFTFDYHFSIAIPYNRGQLYFVEKIVVIFALIIMNPDFSAYSVIFGAKTCHSIAMVEIRPCQN